MKRVLVGIMLCVCASWTLFSVGQQVNYPQHSRVQLYTVNNPQFIPSIELVRMFGSGYDVLVADMYWLNLLLYVGANISTGAYKQYMFKILHVVTDLDPSFVSAYEMGQLLLTSKHKHGPESETYAKEAETLGLKWIAATCHPEKTRTILEEEDLVTLLDDASLQDPCIESNLPFYQAYVYSVWHNSPAQAAQYYKLAAMHEDAPASWRRLAIIMQGKSGDRIASILMFLGLAQSVESGSCSRVAADLGVHIGQISEQWQDISAEFLRQFDGIRQEIESAYIDDIWNLCVQYIQKATREANLYFITQADARYIDEHGTSAPHAKALLDAGFLSYIPEDYDIHRSSPVLYFYNTDIQGWDFRHSVSYDAFE